MPAFGRYVEMDAKAWRVEYQEDNPTSIRWESRISAEDVRRLPSNALLGVGVVEATGAKQLTGSGAVRANCGVKVWHYLYLPNREAAERVARQLQGAAYTTEVRESEPSWLVRASHTIPRSQDALEAIAESLTEVALKEGGEYDGWERET